MVWLTESTTRPITVSSPSNATSTTTMQVSLVIVHSPWPN
jgi:hypothetical protein